MTAGWDIMSVVGCLSLWQGRQLVVGVGSGEGRARVCEVLVGVGFCLNTGKVDEFGGQHRDQLLPLLQSLEYLSPVLFYRNFV